MKKLKRIGCAILVGMLIATSALSVTVNAASWKKDSKGWWYQENNGRWPANQWKLIGGKWYWFQSNGYMATGWKCIGGQWYYLQSNGAMAKNTWIGNYYVNGSGVWIKGKTKSQVGWIKSGNKWWYRHADGGYTRNGWERINGQWYLFDNSGWMLTGWKQVNGKWYYLQSSGAMLNQGWHEINGDWYYMYSGGAMAANTWIGDYFVNSSGKRVDTSQGVYLLDVIKPYSVPNHYEDCTSKSFSMGGTQYTNGFTCMGYGDKDQGNLTYFNLNGEYRELSFTAGILDQDFIGPTPEKVTFRIIADGKEVDNFSISYGALPVSRNVNINNCKQLIISVYSYWGTAFYDGDYGLAEIKVKK